VNGTDVWFYDSSEATAVHITLPDRQAADDHDFSYTPDQIAEHVLERVGPSTDVSVGEDTSVAGRTAYQLVLTPRTSETLVGSITIAVDSETGLPLGVTVHARGQDDPAVQVAFSELTLEVPEDVFSFAPPEGTDVTEHALTEKPTPVPGYGDFPMPTVTGSDWTSVVQLPAGSVPGELSQSPVWNELTTSVSEGRLFHTTLLNVLVTTDGRVFAGAVPAEVLQAAAAG
jgi:hypothetical protein